MDQVKVFDNSIDWQGPMDRKKLQQICVAFRILGQMIEPGRMGPKPAVLVLEPAAFDDFRARMIESEDTAHFFKRPRRKRVDFTRRWTMILGVRIASAEAVDQALGAPPPCRA